MRQLRNRASVLGAVEGLGSHRRLWEVVSALRARVRVQRLYLLGHIVPGAFGYRIRFGKPRNCRRGAA